MADPQVPTPTSPSTDQERVAEARGKRSALLAFLTSRAVLLSPQQKATLEACNDLAQLDAWFAAALAGQGPSQFLGAASAVPVAPPARKGKTRRIVAVVAAVALLGLLAVVGLFAAFAGNGPKLTQGSQRVVSRLTSVMQIDLYATRSVPQVRQHVDDLQALLAQYERTGNGKVKIRIVDASGEQERKAAAAAGLREFVVGAADDKAPDEATIAKVFLGLAFSYKSEKDTIPVLSPDNTQGLEFWITNKIRELQCKADNAPIRIGVVRGKGEIALSERNLVPGPSAPSIATVIQQALPFYRLEEVDLLGGTREIDTALAGLIVTQPGTDYTDAELRRLDQFVMKGRALTVVASAVQVEPGVADMKAGLGWHGLERLLEGYGIRPAANGLVDPDQTLRLAAMTASGAMTASRSPAVMVLQAEKKNRAGDALLDSTFAGFFRLDELAFPLPSGLAVLQDRQPAATFRVAARTGDGALAWTAEGTRLGFDSSTFPAGSPAPSVPIAVVVTGTLQSATAGLAGGKEVVVASRSEPGARVLVIASAQFFANPFVRALGVPTAGDRPAALFPASQDPILAAAAQSYAQKHLTTTILAFKNTMDWMSGDEDLVGTSAVLLRDQQSTGVLGRIKKWFK